MTTFSVNDGSSVLRSSGSASLPVDLTSSRIPVASGGRRNSGLQPSIPLSSSLSTSISHRNKSLVGLTGFIAEATPKDAQPYMMFLNRNTSIVTGTSGTLAITEGKDTSLPLHIPSRVKVKNFTSFIYVTCFCQWLAFAFELYIITDHRCKPGV